MKALYPEMPPLGNYFQNYLNKAQTFLNLLYHPLCKTPTVSSGGAFPSSSKGDTQATCWNTCVLPSGLGLKDIAKKEREREKNKHKIT